MTRRLSFAVTLAALTLAAALHAASRQLDRLTITFDQRTQR